MHLILLILGSALLHNAHSLRCYECTPKGPEACTDAPTDCYGPTQCGAIRISSYAGGSKVADMNMKSCVVAEQCMRASVNFGIAATYINTQCCNTELCNSGFAEGAISTAANGKKCYTCIGADCTTELSCKGDEDLCISTTVDAGSQKMKMMGCASKSVCVKGGIASMMGPGMGVDMTCCEGNLCNGANKGRSGSGSKGAAVQQASLSLLVLLTSALSVTLLH